MGFQWGGKVGTGTQHSTEGNESLIEVLREGAYLVIRPTEVKLEARDQVGIRVPTVHEHFVLDNRRIALSRPDVSSTLRGVRFG